MRIGRRIPQHLVDAVRDADEAIAERDEDAVETEAAGRRAKLVRVRRAHRRHGISKH